MHDLREAVAVAERCRVRVSVGGTRETARAVKSLLQAVTPGGVDILNHYIRR